MRITRQLQKAGNSRNFHGRRTRRPLARSALRASERLDKLRYASLAVAWKCAESAMLERGNPIREAAYFNHRGKRVALSRVFMSAFKAGGGQDSLFALSRKTIPDTPRGCIELARGELVSFIEDKEEAASAIKRLPGRSPRGNTIRIIECIERLLHTLDELLLGMKKGSRSSPAQLGAQDREERISEFVARAKAATARRADGRLP